MSFERWNKYFSETLSMLEKGKRKSKKKFDKKDTTKARHAGKASTGNCGKV